VEQSIERLSPEDLVSVDARRNWVRGHFAPEARHKYEQLAEKLRLIQVILDAGWIG
jgi:hypothetical protein